VSRAVLYMRVSSKEQLEGYSLDAQREAGIKYIADHGWELVDEYEDRAETARTARRKDFQRMLQELEDNRIDYLVVHKSDRFARNKLDHFVTKDLLRKRGVKLVSITENFDDGTPQGRLVEGVMASINEYYSDNLGEEVKKGQRQKIKVGGWPSHAPIGYRNVRRDVGIRQAEALLELDPIQEPLVLELYELYATGAFSERELLGYIVDRGMRTRTGKPPTYNTIHDILTNPFYTGVIVWNGVQYPGNHEPIISPELFEQVQEVLRLHFGGRTRKRIHDHYLRGSLFCDACNYRWSDGFANGNGGRYRYFFCMGRHNRRSTCREAYASVDDLEHQVENIWWRVELPQWVKDRIRRDVQAEVRARLGRAEHGVEAAERRLKELARERERLLKAYLAEAVPMDLMKAEQERIGKEMTVLEGKATRPKVEGDLVERMLERAFGYLDCLREAYFAAIDRERRAWNRLVFKGFWIGGRRVRRYEFTDLFRDLVEYTGSNTGGVVGGEGIEPPASSV
jgi:site-specific DNA recombinase